MDFGAPVAQNVQAPDVTKTLSGLMGLQQQKIGVAQAQQNLQRGAAQTQMTQQDAAQRQAIAGVDWSKYADDTGTLSTDKMLSDPSLRASAGDQMLDVVKAGAGIRQQQLQNKSSLVGLNNGLRDQFGSMVGALRTDPDVIADNATGRQKVTDSIAQFGQAGGPDAQRVAAIYAPVAEHAPQGKLVAGISNIQLQAMDASRQAQAEAPTTSFVPTQAGTQPFNTNPQAAGGVGPQGAPMVPPNQTVPTTGGGVAIGNTTTGQVGSFASRPGAPPVDFPAGENGATQTELQLQRTSAQQAAATAPTMHNLNRGVMAEVDNGTTTGNLGALIQKVKSATGFAGDTGTDYNTLGKLLERSAITASQGMGPHTNAGLEAQVKANGSTDYSPGAIRTIAALNDAATTGSTMYQSGVENVISAAGGSVFAKRKFDQDWAGAMNPSSGVDGIQALRFKNAVDNQDSVEKASILKQVGGTGSKGATALLTKLRSLQQLSGQQ